MATELEPVEVTQERLLRRRCCFFAVVLIAAGFVMLANADFAGYKLPAGMHAPGLALELVRNNQDIYNIAGEPSDQGDAAKQNRETILLLQKLDQWFFIPSYFLFFQSAGLYTAFTFKNARWLGGAVCTLVFLAAVLDYFEDHWIKWSIYHLDTPNPMTISTIAYWKWRMLFMMLICLSPLLFRRWPESVWLRIVGIILGVYAISCGVTGMVACQLHSGSWVELSANGLAAPALFFFPFVVRLARGTLTVEPQVTA